MYIALNPQNTLLFIIPRSIGSVCLYPAIHLLGHCRPSLHSALSANCKSFACWWKSIRTDRGQVKLLVSALVQAGGGNLVGK